MIGIFAALGRELKPIKALFPDLDEFRDSGFLFSTGRLRGVPPGDRWPPPGDINQPAAVLVQTGIGWQRAASAAKIAADRFPLRLCVSTGFAGGLQNSIRAGDLVIGQKIISMLASDPKILTCDPEWTQSAQKAAEAIFTSRRGTGVHLGPIATVRQIVGRSEDKKAVAKNRMPPPWTWSPRPWPVSQQSGGFRSSRSGG
jgi:nucleoside phosphorylase